ncbi:hypothetical protein FJY93_03905 [Candidatus Kaiserbacteria bacterium]|nr:hypothetical protein [Candidatus Kaiserbacteria bacterium]
MSHRLDLSGFGITELGVLPVDPLQRLSRDFEQLEIILDTLPTHLMNHTWGPACEAIPQYDADKVTYRELPRFHQKLAYAASGFVLEGSREGKPRPYIPANIAIPLKRSSDLLGRMPILSYDDYAPQNYRRVSKDGPVALGNIEVMQHFCAGADRRDERWFILDHIEIEAHGGKAIPAVVGAQDAVLDNDPHLCEQGLTKLHPALVEMKRVLKRMPDECDPHAFFDGARLWIWGWKNNPFLPEGVVYQGVEAYGGIGQHLHGETGSQSPTIPMIRAALGVVHVKTELTEYLEEMRKYMPRGHRRLLYAIEARPKIRPFVMRHAYLKDVYNACVTEAHEFLWIHYGYAAEYIQKQATIRGTTANSNQVGTGGTPFMKYLKQLMDETLAARID